jgi:23S rRNA (cytosine1962-C5)-methyltransferase
MELIKSVVSAHLPVGGDARRLFHGRGRSFPGYQDLLIDCYDTLIWVTLFAERSSAWLQNLKALLCSVRPSVTCIAVQRRDLPQAPIEILFGTLPMEPQALEGGLRYLLRPEVGQNIGFFIDMAAGRALVRKQAKGKKVLNLFAYSCSFSVAAIAGGARSVVNVDMNKGALELGRKNHLHNQLDMRSVSFLPLEIFRSISRLRKLGPFDLIICDPPFSQGKNFSAETHWPKLVSRLSQMLAPGGEVIACLNAPHMSATDLTKIFAEEFPSLNELSCFGAGVDFPEINPARALSIQHFVSI